MIRKLWLGVVLLSAGLGAVAMAFHLRQPRTPATPPAAAAARPAPTATAAPARPVASAPARSTRPVVTYDNYRAEIERIRAAREEAQALQANERCIGGKRFRKVGSEWERVGSC